MASKAANENLTDFFEMWGFFEPVNATIEQYGTYKYTVTTSMINEAKAYMAQFPAPKHVFQYIEDRKKNEFPTDDYRYKEMGDVGYYTSFKGNTQITKTVTADVQGQKVSIKNGDEAVAFEIKRDGKLIYFSIFFEFEVPSSIGLDSSCEVYAVQADGKRIKLR